MPKFKTVRFGELEYQEQDVIHLPDGLVGMPVLRDWLVLEMGDDVPMKWFQSLDRGDFGFPLSEAWLYHDNYEFTVPAGICQKLSNSAPSNLVTLIITTIHPGGVLVTGNLMAPLVLDSETRRGAQLTLEDPNWSVRQEIDYRKFALAVGGDSSENAPADAIERDEEIALSEAQAELAGEKNSQPATAEV